MSAKADSIIKTKTEKIPLSTGNLLLLIPAVLLLLFGIIIFAWYGYTYIPVRQRSDILPREVKISSGGITCSLDIPAGTLTLSHPVHAALGSSYKTEAEVRFERPLRFINCSGLPNWNLLLEAQTTLVAAAVRPYASIRQPAFDRDRFSFQWEFTPEEPVPTYQSHLWLRAIINEKEETVERWNILVRDFPMENAALFNQPTILWLIAAGTASALAILLLILLIQRRTAVRRKQITGKVFPVKDK